MDVAFYLGKLAIHWYGILIALAVIAAIGIAIIEAKKRGQHSEQVFNLALIVIPLGIIGGAIGLIIYTRWKKLGTLRWLDITAPGLLLAQAIGRWGNFFNQELYGYPTSLPWAIYIDPNHRLPNYLAFSHFHPLFLYEFLWNLIGFFILIILGRKFQNRLMDGEIFLLYVIYYSVGRFFLEGLKIDVWTIAGVPTARWICGIAIIASIAVIVYRRYRIHHTVSNAQ